MLLLIMQVQLKSQDFLYLVKMQMFGVTILIALILGKVKTLIGFMEVIQIIKVILVFMMKEVD